MNKEVISIQGIRVEEIDKQGDFEFEITSYSENCVLFKYLNVEEAKKLIKFLQENIDKYERELEKAVNKLKNNSLLH